MAAVSTRFVVMAAVSTRAPRSLSTCVCRDQALAWARRAGAERSAVELSPFKIATVSEGGAAGAAAGCAAQLLLEPPPKRLAKRLKPPPVAGALGSWLSAAVWPGGADVVVPSPQGAPDAVRSLLRNSLAAPAGAASPDWLRPAS